MGAVRQLETTDRAAETPAEPAEFVVVDVVDADGSACAAAPDGGSVADPPEAVQGLVDQYLAELRDHLRAPIEALPPPPGVRRVYGGLAVAALGLVVGVVVVVVVIWNTGLPVWSREGVAAAPGGAACVARQEEVMAALAAYAGEHGGPPPALDSLRPQYLADAPADPTSGTPFRYTRDGAGVLLTCPDHPLGPHIDSQEGAPGVPQG